MVGLGATHQTLLKRSHVDALSDSRSSIARFVARIADFYLGFPRASALDGAHCTIRWQWVWQWIRRWPKRVVPCTLRWRPKGV